MRPDDRQQLLRSLTPDQYITCVRVAQTYPILEVISSDAKVVGEEIITPQSYVTLFLKVKMTTRKAEGETAVLEPKPKPELLPQGSVGNLEVVERDVESAMPTEKTPTG